MSIQSFLDEVRFNTVTAELEMPMGDNPDKSTSELIADIAEVAYFLKSLTSSSNFLIENYYGIRADIDNVFNKIDDKIEKLTILAEGFQHLNTNELSNDTIHSLSVFNLKDKEGYNDLLQSLTLPRLNKARHFKPTKVVKNHIETEETFRLLNTYRDSILTITKIDDINTELLRADLLNDKRELITSVLPKNNKVTSQINEDVKYIKVITNNVDLSHQSFTNLSILANKYENYHSVTLGGDKFDKDGDVFKLILDQHIPTESHLSYELKFSYTNKYTNELEESTLYFNSLTSREVLVDKNKVSGIIIDLNGNRVDVRDTLDDYVFTKEFSSKDSVVKHLGGKVFDISKIRADTFNVTLRATFYNNIDDTKSPEIKGVFAYVTKRL